MQIFKKIMKWLGFGIGTLLVLIITASLIANTIFNRELRHTMEALKAQGRPMTIAELMPPVSDDENAAPLIMEANDLIPSGKDPAPSAMKNLTALIKTNYSAEKACTDITGWTEAHREEGARLIQSSEIKEMYALLRNAVMRPHYKRNLDWSDEIAFCSSNLASYRMLFRILAIKAGFEWQDGNLDQALNTILIGLRVNNKSSEEPILITQLARRSIDNMLIDELKDLTNAHEIPEETTQALIKEMALHIDRSPWCKAMDGERLVMGMWVYDRLTRKEMHKFMSTKGIPRVREWMQSRAIIPLLKPIVTKDYIAYLKLMPKVQQHFETPYYLLQQKLTDKQTSHHALFIHASLQVYDKLYEMVAEDEAQVDICRVGLALKLFQQKNGTYPETLDKLTPEFLENIPVDPFTGKALIYRQADAGFILYSSGPNQRDDNGVPKPTGKNATGEEPDDIVWKCAK